MSGLELAGIILATFPLIINGLEQYENGFQLIKEWARVRTEFNVFMEMVGKQQLFFRQHIEELLAPIVKSEDHMDWLLENPAGKGWQDPELEGKLRKRLMGMDEYKCYMSTVGSILASLDKLKRKLKLVDGQAHWTENANSSGRVRVEYEYRRLLYSLGRKQRNSILEKIEKHNNDLQSILSNSERLAPSRLKRKSPISKHFQEVRNQASSLHTALSKAWKCDCSLGHVLKLLLERRVKDPTDKEDLYDDFNKHEDKSIKFKLYFHLMPSNSGPQAEQKCKLTEWCATEITMDLATTCPEFSTRIAGSPGDLLSNTYLPVPTSPIDSIGKSSDPASFTSSLTKSVSKSRRPLLEDVRRVSFADTSCSYSKSVASLADMSEIIDLCSALNQRVLLQQNFGYLRERGVDQMHTITLTTNSQLPSGKYTVVNLKTLLDKDLRKSMNLPPVLDRRRVRLEVAVILASSLLQLCPGPWLTEQWGKSDIYFFQSADGIIHTHLPFLLCKFNSSRETLAPIKSNHDTESPPVSPLSRCGYNTPLLSLGILILELWFNQTIESLPFRKDYLGAGGNETEYTDYNTAQRWQAQTMDEAGVELHNPTRRCIYCAFGAASQNLEDDELRKAVYDDVVQPLERLLQRFEEV